MSATEKYIFIVTAAIEAIGWGLGVVGEMIPPSVGLGIAIGGFVLLGYSLTKLLRRRQLTKSGKEIFTKTSESNTRLLEDIKSDLLKLSVCERDTATEKAKQICSNEIAKRIYDDCTAIWGKDFGIIIRIVKSIFVNHDLDPLINFFKEIGDILDSNDYGLKAELQKNEAYKSYRMDVAQKRLRIKMGKKKSAIIQKNIDRVYSLTYGLNSSILLRAVFNSMAKVKMPQAKKKVLAVIRVTLEKIETETEKVLNAMLNDLESEWKVTT